jgi:NitT/TauT family transport system substrate-binding protein
VIVDMAMDRPWSQYFCCVLVGRTGFVQQYPVATKRALRAILKATDLCATEPEDAARLLVKGGFVQRYDGALQPLIEVPYDVWRELDPEDSMRFYALWLHEFGMINSTPKQDHRRGHRLEVPQRYKARAEGVRSRQRRHTAHRRQPAPAAQKRSL